VSKVEAWLKARARGNQRDPTMSRQAAEVVADKLLNRSAEIPDKAPKPRIVGRTKISRRSCSDDQLALPLLDQD
jgi:hypothetical protein